VDSREKGKRGTRTSPYFQTKWLGADKSGGLKGFAILRKITVGETKIFSQKFTSRGRGEKESRSRRWVPTDHAPGSKKKKMVPA